ncbi:hypothetical protein CYMTET_39271 [Cymbomonas tetramitiformis]|uniref:Uncharacterized protein n=1 Tax=Cymbomonas tetramitiformis TaxID=36881 RepID=A0AAE0CC32_9CHLO|nr:hypothetical protein CYMTET_39271 [Cymbomonas tetramitiformis]
MIAATISCDTVAKISLKGSDQKLRTRSGILRHSHLASFPLSQPRASTFLCGSSKTPLLDVHCRTRYGTQRCTFSVNAAVANPPEKEFSETLRTFAEGDLLLGTTPDGKPIWIEVVESPTASSSGTVVQGVASGSRVSISSDSSGQLTLKVADGDPIPEAMFAQFEGKRVILKGMGMDPVTKALQEALTAQMVEVGSTAQLTDVTREYSFAQLCEAVKADPRYWCDGAMDADGSFESDGGAPSTVVRDMLTQAGELVALLQGARGLVLVQLWSLQVSTGALHYPFVLRLLRMICEDPALKMSLSTTATPEGEPVGFSAVVHAAQSPFEEYTKFLAELGVQSALVPDDALSKILIGQALGYKKEHIVSYVQSKGQEVTSEMEEQLASGLKEVSEVKPSIPWRVSDVETTLPVGKVAESKTGGFGAKAGKAFGAGKKRKSKGRK